MEVIRIFTFPPKTKSHPQIREEKGGHGEAPNSFRVAKNLKHSNAIQRAHKGFTKDIEKALKRK
ncbi:MAG: hypothetical protein DMG65_11790 [Candidatus Angelobacter sp. Gp1-AA117]|nr:MAG: hypothetical protein DMG65_11790 [Candidatus Angelobacter sp. Gp1-AA117]